MKTKHTTRKTTQTPKKKTPQIHQLLHKIHRPGKKALSLFGMFLEHVRETEGMNITRNEEEEEEELPPPDVDASSLQRVLERHPLFSSLPESVLTSLITKFELRTWCFRVVGVRAWRSSVVFKREAREF